MTDREHVLFLAHSAIVRAIELQEFGAPTNAVQLMRNESAGDDVGFIFSFDEAGVLNGFRFTRGIADGA